MAIRNLSKMREEAPNACRDAASCTKVATALCSFLASTYALYQKSLFYHWNVTGSHFFSLHRLFQQHYEDLHQAGDEIAERIRALGRFAPGTLAEYAELSKIKEDTTLPPSGKAMVEKLLHSHEVCSSEARHVMEVAEEAEDSVTVDMMVHRMRFHDKAAWMLRAFLHEETKQ